MASNGSAVVSPHERFLISSIDLQLVLHHHQHAFSLLCPLFHGKGQAKKNVGLFWILLCKFQQYKNTQHPVSET